MSDGRKLELVDHVGKQFDFCLGNPIAEKVEFESLSFEEFLQRCDTDKRNKLNGVGFSSKKFSFIYEVAGSIKIRFYDPAQVSNRDVDTHIRSDFTDLTLKGARPLFIMGKNLHQLDWWLNLPESEQKKHAGKACTTLYFETTLKTLMDVICDRLQQYLGKTGHSDAVMLEDDIAAVLRWVDAKPLNSFNARLAAESRVLIVPAREISKKDRLVIPYGRKGWSMWSYTPGDRLEHSLGDGYRSGKKLNRDTLALANKYLPIFASSDSGIAHGNYVCLDPEVQKLRGNVSVLYDALGLMEIGDVILSSHNNPKQFPKRIQSNISSQAFEMETFRQDVWYEHDGIKLFPRHRNILKQNKDSLDKEITELNVLTVYEQVDPKLFELFGRKPRPGGKFDSVSENDVKAFFDTDKMRLSRLMEGTDGGSFLSDRIASTGAVRERVFKSDLRYENFVPKFQAMLEDIKKTGNPMRWPRWKPFGIYTECLECGNKTVPMVDSYTTFKCPVCDKTYTNVQKEDIKGERLQYDVDPEVQNCRADYAFEKGKKFRTSTEIENEDLGTETPRPTAIQCRIPSAIRFNRMVGNQLKFMNKAVHQDVVGYIEIDGKQFPVDMVCFDNGNKAAESEVFLACLRLAVARAGKDGTDYPMTIGDILTGANIYPEDIIATLKDRIIIDPKYFERCKVIRRKWNDDSDNGIDKEGNPRPKGRYEMVETMLFCGITTIRSTEAGPEFVKNHLDATKFTFQMWHQMVLLGKGDLALAIHEYNMEHNAKAEKGGLSDEIVLSMIQALFGTNTKLPVIKDLSIVSDLVKGFSFHSLETNRAWTDMLKTNPWFKEPELMNGFVLEIPTEKEPVRIEVIPSKIIERFVKVISGNQVRLPYFLTSLLGVFRTMVTMMRKEILRRTVDNITGEIRWTWRKISDDNVTGNIAANTNKYYKGLVTELTGKHGLVSRIASPNGFSYGSKEWSCHLLPPGVIVVNEGYIWKRICEEYIKVIAANKTPDERKEYLQRCIDGKEPIYALSHRDPDIWPYQATGVVQLWSVPIANDWFWDRYGILYAQFTETRRKDPTELAAELLTSKIWETFNKSLFVDPVGMCVNTLDMVYLFQADADGDYRRVLVPFGQKVQGQLWEYHQQMQNYDFINPFKLTDNEDHNQIVQSCTRWQLSYLMGEMLTNKHNMEVPHYFPLRASRAEIAQRSFENSLAKLHIAYLTTSYWRVMLVSEYMYKRGLLSKKERDEVICLYGCIFVQDTGIRNMKYYAALGPYAPTTERLGLNTQISVKPGDPEVPIRDLVLDVNRTTEGGPVPFFENRIFENLFKVCEYSEAMDGTYLPNLNSPIGANGQHELVINSTLGDLVSVIIGFVYGSKVGLTEFVNGKGSMITTKSVKKALDLLKRPEVDYFFHKDALKFLIDALESGNRK